MKKSSESKATSSPSGLLNQIDFFLPLPTDTNNVLDVAAFLVLGAPINGTTVSSITSLPIPSPETVTFKTPVSSDEVGRRIYIKSYI
jgi:hypothetical protein